MSQTPPVPPVSPPPMSYAIPVQQRSGMAIASMVLGILSLVLCQVFGIVGLILGIMALGRTRRHPHQYGGRGHALAGLATSPVGLLPVILIVPRMGAGLLPSLSRARELAKRALTTSNLRGVGVGLMQYSQDHGVFPPTLGLLIDGGYIAADVLQNPSQGDDNDPGDFFYVAYVADAYRVADPATWIVAYGDPNDHNGEGASVLYFDGHVNFVRQPQFDQDLQRFLSAYEQRTGVRATVVPPR